MTFVSRTGPISANFCSKVSAVTSKNRFPTYTVGTGAPSCASNAARPSDDPAAWPVTEEAACLAVSAADRVAALALSMTASIGVDGSGGLVSVGFSDVRIASSACSSSFGGCSEDAGSEAAESEESSASHLRCRIDE